MWFSLPYANLCSILLLICYKLPTLPETNQQVRTTQRLQLSVQISFWKQVCVFTWERLTLNTCSLTYLSVQAWTRSTRVPVRFSPLSTDLAPCQNSTIYIEWMSEWVNKWLTAFTLSRHHAVTGPCIYILYTQCLQNPPHSLSPARVTPPLCLRLLWSLASLPVSPLFYAPWFPQWAFWDQNLATVFSG